MSRVALAMVLVAAVAAPVQGEPDDAPARPRPAPPAPPPFLRRLEAVQLGLARHAHYLDFSPESGIGPTLSLEAGRFVDPAIGFSAFVRGQYYSEDDEDDSFSDPKPRSELLLGARVYFQPTDRMLAALGAGLLVTRYRFFDTKETAAQKFVEVYGGRTFRGSRCTDLEAGVNIGYSPDEEYVWIGLAVGARRRMW